MFEAFFEGLLLVFQWPAIGFLVLGVLIGIWLGAVPGLGGAIGLVLLIPFTFNMDPVPAFALLLGMYAVTATSDTIASVMLGIPGTSASQATILDGYPLAQKGQAARAFGAAFTVSAFGGVFGAFILALSLPLILPIILAFNSPELFMLGVLGLSMVGSLSGGSMVKGLAVAALGLLMSTIGYAETDAIPRYYLGTDYLLAGLPLIPVVLGLFAVPEIMELALRNTSISRVEATKSREGSLLQGIKDAFKNWWLATRCAAIGTYIGMLPGLGAAIVDWLAYGHAVQSAKDKSKFGQGDIRGVIAPEAANNATRGGSLLPTVAFGIPGNLGTAILLGALLIQGLRPGPDMLTTELHVTFSMVWSIVVANIVVAVLLMMWSNQVAKIAFVPGHLLVPGVILFVFMGSWLGGGALGDWITVFVMGLVGFFMKRGGWPRPPLILALILGSIMENSFQLTMRVYQDLSWLLKPINLTILVLIIITLVLAARGITTNRRADTGDKEKEIVTGEGSEKNPVVSLPFAIALLIFFGWALVEALPWPSTAGRFPVTAAVPGIGLVLLAVIADARAYMGAVRDSGGLHPAWAKASEMAVLDRAIVFFGYLAAMIILALIIGQKLAIPIFIAVYLIRWGKYSTRFALTYAAGGWVLLVGFYDRIMNLLWHNSWLSDWLPEALPAFVPAWLFV